MDSIISLSQNIQSVPDIEIGQDTGQDTKRKTSNLSNLSNVQRSIHILNRNQKLIIGILILFLLSLDFIYKLFEKE